MADETYAKLLERFEATPANMSDPLRANVLVFYGSSAVPSSEKARAVLTGLRANPSADPAN